MFIINNQYLVLEEIGRGGFGTVWKAYDFSLKNFVAIKKLNEKFSEVKFIEMFYKEALIAKTLIHDNIVRVNHFWQGDDGGYYLLMDYVRGSDLEYILKKCKDTNTTLPWEYAIFICIKVLKALNYANKIAQDPSTGKPYSLIHRDVSPGNIFIDYEANVKISDFGIAKTAEEISRKIKERIVTGKYSYMSPEQIRGETDIDIRSDIFSMGIVLYEMLTQIQLFTGNTDMIENKILHSKIDIEPLKELDIPQELINIVLKSLEKERRNRYQSPMDMIRDIKKLIKEEEIEELASDFSNFIRRILSEELKKETEDYALVKDLNLQDIIDDPKVKKITCWDFIPGGFHSELLPKHTEERVIERSKSVRESGGEIIDVFVGDSGEKARTVFEEVGDWLINKFKLYKKRLLKIGIASVFAAILFIIIDTFLPHHITPLGRRIYSKLFPPDVVISTIPEGANITIKTRDGNVILPETRTTIYEPTIELRNILPGSYIVNAIKDGFIPIEQVITIEEKTPNNKRSYQEINLVFDISINIDSEPSGADVFINGSKLGKTPWNYKLKAGRYSIELSLDGFENLGSKAKETKPGQCNLDFTHPDEKEIFKNADPKYWSYHISTIEGVKVFNLKGRLFKKFYVNSFPEGAMVYVDSGPAIGVTPIEVLLTVGKHNLRFSKPEGEYKDAEKVIEVDKDSKPDIFVLLDRWVYFKAVIKDQPEKLIPAKVKIKGKGINISKETLSGKMLKIALPIGKYDVSFDAGKKYKVFNLKNIDVSKTNTIIGKLEFQDPVVQILVKEEKTNNPISGAYVWVNNSLKGRTDATGRWMSQVKCGENLIRIVAEGYQIESINRNFSPGEEIELSIVVRPEIPVETKISSGTTVPTTTPVEKNQKLEEEEKEEKIECPECGTLNPVTEEYCEYCDFELKRKSQPSKSRPSQRRSIFPFFIR